MATEATGPWREFRKLWAASACSNLGDGVSLIAAPLLAAALTSDPVQVAGLTFAQRVPWLLFPLISGAIVDRLDRRRVMQTISLARALLLGALGIAVLLDQASIPMLYVVFFLLGTGETIVDPASVTILPAIVPRTQLPRANARLAGTTNVLNIFAGPPLGGFLFAIAATVPFLMSAGTYAAAAVFFMLLRGSFRAERAVDAPQTTLWAEIGEGVGWLRRHGLLRTLAITLGIMNLTNTATVSIMVLFAQERLGLGPGGFGILLATEAIGGIAASLVAERIIGWLGPGRTLRIGLLIEATTPAIIAFAQDPYVTGAMLALFGFHAVVWGVFTTSLRQELIPEQLLGRVNSGFTTIGIGSATLGAPLGGLLAKSFGLAAPFWISSLVVGLLAVVVWPIFGNKRVQQAQQEAQPQTAA